MRKISNAPWWLGTNTYDVCLCIFSRPRTAYGLPTTTDYTAQALAAAAALADKKRRGDTLPLVLPEAIGRCRLEPVPVSELPDWFRDGGLL